MSSYVLPSGLVSQVSRAAKPPLLFMSPTIPALTGSGIAMRAGMMLEALAADHDVHLLVLPVVLGASDEIAPEIEQWCARVVVHPLPARGDAHFQLIARVRDPAERLAASLAYPRPLLCRFATRAAVRDAAARVAETRFEEVHVFRLYLAPFAEPYLDAGTRCRLDLDDHESRTRSRLGALHAAAGAAEAAAIEGAEAEKYSAMEARCLPRFHRVYACSESDRAELIRLHGLDNVRVIPNGIRVPATAPRPREDGPFTLLFVGSLGYYPNEDAVLFFCAEVLPRLRRLARGPFRLHVVGTHPPASLHALSRHADVRVIGPVDEMGAAYAQAHAAVIPLRAGGGTRIKMLEAFAHRVPVVSTSLGAEGLAVCHDTHLLLADTAQAMAEQCLRLMEDPVLGASLAERALQLVKAGHTPEHIRALLREDHAERGAPP